MPHATAAARRRAGPVGARLRGLRGWPRRC